ncbi:MAG: hypothetical protein JOS17DRAFT_395879 [Linnemannia elongata]|nr:MAG: hypothetical protein JOS17DRAFT_395879 [Linnemannia elongata]
MNERRKEGPIGSCNLCWKEEWARLRLVEREQSTAVHLVRVWACPACGVLYGNALFFYSSPLLLLTFSVPHFLSSFLSLLPFFFITFLLLHPPPITFYLLDIPLSPSHLISSSYSYILYHHPYLPLSTQPIITPSSPLSFLLIPVTSLLHSQPTGGLQDSHTHLQPLPLVYQEKS